MTKYDDHEYPDCPNCETNLLVAGNQAHGPDFRCFGCHETFNDPRQSGWEVSLRAD